MCSINGFSVFPKTKSNLHSYLKAAIESQQLRGPDNQSTYISDSVGLGHTRLSIIDTSSNANQPMSDPSGRYTIVFNGEIYNYKELQASLPQVEFRSSSDTEVLLYLLIEKGEDCLKDLNGFFAFAFYDKKKNKLILARDQMGIKPLHFYQDDEQFLFASEIKALLRFPFKRKIDHKALSWYLRLNYLPGNMSMLQGVKKLEPGHYLHIRDNQISEKSFVADSTNQNPDGYEESQTTLVKLLEDSVQKRLIADVPLGSFLSGGTDSSTIVSLASKYHSNLSTFSIGYKDHPFFDETHYAELVAHKFKTNHTTFSLTNDDLLSDLNSIIDYIDEPFADSSAIPTYILSKHTRKHVKVALSGDGADELFGGYYKHLALSKVLQGGVKNQFIRSSNPLFRNLPQSRSGMLQNTFRRINRFGYMLKLNPTERYWFLASLTYEPSFLLANTEDFDLSDSFDSLIPTDPSLNDYLQADQKIVLTGDMLTKVDLMSMANSLEVRVPFLDKEVVNFANSLPASYKVNGNQRKRILQDAFKNILPKELYHRSKKGFEVPLLHWMRNELLSELDETLFNEGYLSEQGLFNLNGVMNLRRRLKSSNPGDVHGTIWALYIFQKWYSNYFES